MERLRTDGEGARTDLTRSPRSGAARRGLRPAVRIVVVSHEPLEGRGLALLLRADAQFDTIWAETTTQARRMLGGTRQDVLLWSGDVLDGATLDEFGAIRTTYPDVGVCVIAGRADVAAVEAFLSREAQRFALLLRRRRLEIGDLVSSLEGVLYGRSTVEPHVIEQILGAHGGPLAPLTRTERDVLELVAAGLRNRAIARELWRSEKAVEKQVSHIFCKLGLPAHGNGDVDRRVAAARIFLLGADADGARLLPGSGSRLPVSSRQFTA